MNELRLIVLTFSLLDFSVSFSFFRLISFLCLFLTPVSFPFLLLLLLLLLLLRRRRRRRRRRLLLLLLLLLFSVSFLLLFKYKEKENTL